MRKVPTPKAVWSGGQVAVTESLMSPLKSKQKKDKNDVQPHAEKFKRKMNSPPPLEKACKRGNSSNPIIYFQRVTSTCTRHQQRNKMAAKIEKVDMSLDDIIKQNKKNTRGGRGGRNRRGRGGGGPVRGGRGRINKNRSTPYSRVSTVSRISFEHSITLNLFPSWSTLMLRLLTYISFQPKQLPDRWQHDLFDGDSGFRGGRNRNVGGGISTGCKLHISNLDFGVSDSDIQVNLRLRQACSLHLWHWRSNLTEIIVRDHWQVYFSGVIRRGEILTFKSCLVVAS